VAGVTRARLVGRARAAGYDVEECDPDLNEILAADEVMLCNSVIGLRRIARLEQRVWPLPIISSRLSALLDA
jgi:4-amino-4-deoxychorismate lyase